MNRRGWQQWDLSRPEVVRGGWGWFLEPQGSFSTGAGSSVEVRGQPGHPRSPHPLLSCLHLPWGNLLGDSGQGLLIQSRRVGLPGTEQGGEGLEVHPEGQTETAQTDSERMREAGIQAVLRVRCRERQLKGARDHQTEDCLAHRVRMSERRLILFIGSVSTTSSLQGRRWQSSVDGLPGDTGFKLLLEKGRFPQTRQRPYCFAWFFV